MYIFRPHIGWNILKYVWLATGTRSNNCILTDFEKLLYRSQSFAQTNFYSYIENIFSKFNHQKLNPFEGLAHC